MYTCDWCCCFSCKRLQLPDEEIEQIRSLALQVLMRHTPLTEESYFNMFIELLKTALSNDNNTIGEDNEDVDNTGDTDSDNALQ